MLNNGPYTPTAGGARGFAGERWWSPLQGIRGLGPRLPCLVWGAVRHAQALCIGEMRIDGVTPAVMEHAAAWKA